MPGRRSVSVEPEDLVVASPRRRSARIAIRTDSPAPVLKKELAGEKSSTPAKRTRRSLSIQEKSLNDIEKDVHAISHHSKSRTASSSTEQTGVAARRTRRSASTQETHVVPDDLKKDDKPVPVKRSKRLLSKETDAIVEDDDKPEPMDDDDAVVELNATTARKRLTRSMSRSPTNTQKSKTSAPPVVKTFRGRLSAASDKHLEDTKPTVLDIITENEDEINDKNENDKPTLETDMLNNNAKKFSEDVTMETDGTGEDSASKSDLPAASLDGGILKSAGTESVVQTSEEMVLNTSVKSTTVEETNPALTSTNKMNIAESVTEKQQPSNEENALNEKKTDSMNMETSSVENIKVPESSAKLDGSIKETIGTEEVSNVSIVELNEAKNCDVPINESESGKESTVDKINSVLLEKQENSDLIVDLEIADDSEPVKNGDSVKTDEDELDNKIDSAEETIEKLEVTQDEEMMDKLVINEEPEETSINGTLSSDTNENKDESGMVECTDSVEHESRDELDEKAAVKSSEMSSVAKEEEEETTQLVVEIKVTENSVDTSEEENKDHGNDHFKQIAEVTLPELNSSSNSSEELDVVGVQSCEKQTDLTADEQSVTVANNTVPEQRVDSDVSPRKVKQLELSNSSNSAQELDVVEVQTDAQSVTVANNTVPEQRVDSDVSPRKVKQLELSNSSSISAQELDVVEVQTEPQSITVANNTVTERVDSDVSPSKVNQLLEPTDTSEVNSEPVNKDDSVSNQASGDVHTTPSDKSTTREDDVTNISIVSTDNKTLSTVDKCADEENCETNISIVDSPDSNISSTPIKAAGIEQSDSAKKEHLNLSLVNDDGSSYSPIIHRVENISVHFEYSTGSVVDSSGAALQEHDVLTKNETTTTGDDVELVTEDSCQEQNETNQEKSENLNSTLPKEATMSIECSQSEDKQLDNSIKEVCQIDNSTTENIQNDEILNKSSKTKNVLDTSSNENWKLTKIDLPKSESPKNAINESTKAQELDLESTEQARDKMLDDFIECYKAEKKRKRQSSDEDCIAERQLTQKKRRKHKAELQFSSESDETSDIDGSDRRYRNRDKRRNISDDSEEEESDEYEDNEFIDDMASEGSEETPSLDSNEIIDEGESVGSSESQLDSDDDYEHGSFVVDDDVGNEELLSGGEDVECWTPKRKRIITIASDTDDELEKMSLEPFGGSSPSLISINQISSVDSDLEAIKSKNEELSRMIEAEAKSDTEDVDNEDVVIVNESMNKSHADQEELKANIEQLSESILKRTVENSENNEKIQHLVEELQDAIRSADVTVVDDESDETKSPLTEPVNELNTADEQEKLIETNVHSEQITEGLTVEEKAVDNSSKEEEILTEVAVPEKQVCNEVADSAGTESDDIHSAEMQEDKEKDARYQAILDKYFKHFDNQITKRSRRRTVGVVENSNDTNKETTSKRKRRQSLDTGDRNTQSETVMFEAFYNERKKAKLPMTNDVNEDETVKTDETESKKSNGKVKRRTTDENEGIGDVGEQKRSLKSAKRHSLTNIENIPGKYVQSPTRISQSFTGFSSTAREAERHIESDNAAESAAWMLKDFSDTVKDDIRAAKAHVLSPKKKKQSLSEGGILVVSASANNTSDLANAKPSPQKPTLLAASPLKRKKKHSQSLDQEEQLPTSEVIKQPEEVHSKSKKKKKQRKLVSNDSNNEQADKERKLEISKKQGKHSGNNKKSNKLSTAPAAVGEINAAAAGKDIKQKYKHSNLLKNNAGASCDVSETTGVKLIEHKTMNNKKAKQQTSKSFSKHQNKHPSLAENRFVVKRGHATATKSEYDVANELVARNINIYKNLIRPSGRGTTGANITVETLHAASIRIKREKKKQKYNRKTTAVPVAVASVAGQANCSNFKEEFLFGKTVKRVPVSEILQKRRNVK